MDDLPINQPTPEIAKWHDRWKKNRAFVAGEDAVKALGQLFLPKIRPDDSKGHYDRHLENTCFYPAANKIAMGMQGLIDRKPAKFECDSPRAQLLAKSITSKNHSLTDLGRRQLREKIITDFTGLLADHPSRDGFTGLNAENADRKGYRARINLYKGESILEVTEGPVGLNHQLVNVRLLEEGGKQVRQLLINDDGLYEQRVFKVDQDGAFGNNRYTVNIPTINGKPLTEIPFVLDTSEGGTCPSPSILQTAVDLNLQHYRLSGQLANMTWMTSGPQVIITEFSREIITREDGTQEEVDPEWDFGPNGVIEIKGSAKPEYFTFDPKNSALITSQLDKLESKLSSLNHSILAPEKAAPEAPESLILRRVAENATLAGFTADASTSMEKALTYWVQWIDGTPLTFNFNSDFTPAGITPAQHKEIREDWASGMVSQGVALQALVDGEVYPGSLDVEATIELAKMDADSRPPLGL